MIPFLDLRAQYESLRPEIDQAIQSVLESSEFILGSAVERFEEAFATFCGARYAVAVNSGTSALHLALLALDIGPRKEVITVPSTFVATVAAIRYTGAQPVLVDIDPDRFTIDPNKIEAAITSRTAAIIPVHLYGQMADMESICSIAERHGLAIIEDAAQAHGATFGRKGAGTFGVAGCFSFYPGKVLGAFGEGGAIVTDDNNIARRVRAMRDWGQAERTVHHYPGFNYRMDGVQGAVLAVKLRRVREWIAARKRIAARYDQLFSDHVPSSVVELPRCFPDGEHIYHQYAIRTEPRDQLRAKLNFHGVQTAVHYPLPVHLQPGYTDLGYRRGDFPVAEALSRRTLSLPIYPELPASAPEEIVEAISRIVKSLDRTQLVES
jgi:dTDP-4-amino-4,6-dideoxygalactose transaminase